MKVKNVLVTVALTVSAMVVLIGALMLAGASTTGTLDANTTFDQNTPITTTHGNITLQQIAEIQPGLGTVMIEYGSRMWTIYYAAKSGNWDLAQYQLKEAKEIQETGETTRTSRAPMLKAFEASYLNPLQDTMNATNWTAFQTQYNNTVDGCNACHAANGFSYIKYTLPSNPPDLP
jgi:hypothetical protein